MGRPRWFITRLRSLDAGPLKLGELSTYKDGLLLGWMRGDHLTNENGIPFLSQIMPEMSPKLWERANVEMPCLVPLADGEFAVYGGAPVSCDSGGIVVFGSEQVAYDVRAFLHPRGTGV